MPRYVIERKPGAGGWSAEQMQKVAEKSRAVLREMGPEIQWARRAGRVPVRPCVFGARGDRPDHRRAEPMGDYDAYVREAGAGEPVICLHASASSSAQWRPLIDRLAGRFRTLAVDLHGCGRSPDWRGDRPLALADEVALLEPVMAAAGARFHLIGHSYGGAVALKVALAHPGWLVSLLLFEPVLFSVLTAQDPDHPAAREIEAVRADTSAAADRGDLAAAAARFVDYWMGAGAWTAMPETRRRTIAPTMGKIKGQWHAAFEEPAPLPAFATLEVPTLFLVGSDSPASSRAVSRLLAKTMPRAAEIELSGVGHMGPVTHPDRVNTLIEAHLDGRAPGC